MIFQWQAQQSLPFVFSTHIRRFSFNPLGRSVLSHVFHCSASWLAPSCFLVPCIPFDSLSGGPDEPAQQVFLGDKRQGPDGMDGWERRGLCRPMGGCGVRLLGPSCLMGMARVK